jgi:hypothetical protein
MAGIELVADKRTKASFASLAVGARARPKRRPPVAHHTIALRPPLIIRASEID